MEKAKVKRILESTMKTHQEKNFINIKLAKPKKD